MPGPDTGPELAKVLAGLGRAETEDALDELVELGLLQSAFAARYRPHDLIRLFARRQLGEVELAAVRARAVDWLLETAILAGRWFEPGYAALPPGWEGSVPLGDRPAAHRWLTAEADSWLAALELAAGAGRWQRVVDVAEAMHWFSERWLHWGHWPRVFALSSGAAERLDDHAAAATHLNYQSWARCVCADDTAGAADCARRAHAHAVLAGDEQQQALADAYLAVALNQGGDPDAAMVPSARAVRRFQDLGDREGLVLGLSADGMALEAAGRIEEALESYRRRLALVSDPATAPTPLVASLARMAATRDLGVLLVAQGRWAEAVETIGPALASEAAGDVPQIQGQLYAALGEAHCALGRPALGLAELDRAVSIYRQVADRRLDAAVRLRRRLGGA